MLLILAAVLRVAKFSFGSLTDDRSWYWRLEPLGTQELFSDPSSKTK